MTTLLDEVYTDRAHLVALLAGTYPAVKTPALDVEEPGWWLVYIYVMDQQLSWHISPQDAHLLANIPNVPAYDWRAQWDGHSTPQKHVRIRQALGLVA